jgi:hypothetical protein
MTLQDLVMNTAFWGGGGAGAYIAHRHYGFGLLGSLGCGFLAAVGLVIVLLGLVAVVTALASPRSKPPAGGG